MSKFTFIEDIFLEFHTQVMIGQISIQYQDQSPISSFYDKIYDGEQLTANQGSYLLKLLEKYKKIAKMSGYDYSLDLATATWKQPFRVLDLTKKIYIEKNNKGQIEICLKFPYQLKQDFDKEIDINLPNSNRVSYWDHENKVRRLNFYEFNLMHLYEFATKHSFEIDESFLCALSDVEEIWQTEENIRPTCYIENDFVIMKNCSDATSEWISGKVQGLINDDLLLAKSMGFLLEDQPRTMIEKIASSPNNTFWLKSNEDLFKIYNSISGKIAVILDRSGNTLDWLKQFVADAQNNLISRDEIKVCFRDSKEDRNGINEWIKLAGVGGKVDTGRILIFEHKPAKWLFKEDEDVKIVVTNNLYPHTNQLTKDWLDSHPCVIFLGDIKPSEQRGKKIVEL